MMKRTFIGLLFLLTLPIQAAAGEPPLANAGRKGFHAKSIDDMFALPDEEIDVGLGALLIGKEYDPDLDVPKYLAQLDTMALELRSRIGDEKDPRKIIAIMNDYIFRERGCVAADPEKPQSGDTFLHAFLQQKKGPPSCFCSLYLTLAERLGFPLSGVMAPMHVFVRYTSGDTTINMEMEKNGENLPDSHYIEKYRVPQTESIKSIYMKNLSKRQFLGVLLINLSSEYGIHRRYEPALRASKKALEINPNFAEAWIALGIVCEYNGKPDEAIQACRKGLEINPDSAEGWRALGAAYGADRKLDDAIRAFKKVLDIDPGSAHAWYNLGLAYTRQREFDRAVEAYRKALHINPQYVEAWNNLGVAYAHQGKDPAAIRAYKKAINIEPNHANAWYGIGIIYYYAGDYPLASKHLRKAQELGHKAAPEFLRKLRDKVE